MEISDIISAVSCGVAVISAFLSYRFSSKSNSYSKDSLKAAQDSAKSSSAQLETYLRSEIRSASANAENAGTQITVFRLEHPLLLTDAEKQHSKVLTQAWNRI